MNPRNPIKTGYCFLAWNVYCPNRIILCIANKAYNHKRRGRVLEAWVINEDWTLGFINGHNGKYKFIVLPIPVGNCARRDNIIIEEAKGKLKLRGLM